jgi:hypothetical protein
MSALSDLQTQAAAVGLTPVIASGPTSGPYVAYHLVASTVATDGDTFHIGNGHSIAQLAASITAGTPIVVRPSAQQTSGPLDQPTYG